MQENVFKVCDEPHPLIISGMVEKCLKGELESAHWDIMGLCSHGYAASDIVSTVFRVVRLFVTKKTLRLFVKTKVLRGARHDVGLRGGADVPRLCMCL